MRIKDTCLHASVSSGTEELRWHIVRCPAHGWRYDVTKGGTIGAPEYGDTPYPVQVLEGTILMDVM